MEKEKAYIPHTDPAWDLELPDGFVNSLVDKNGTSHDDGYNFDERDDPDEFDEPQLPKEDTSDFDPEAAQKAREERIRELRESLKKSAEEMNREVEPRILGTTKDGKTVRENTKKPFQPTDQLTMEKMAEAISQISTGNEDYAKDTIELDGTVGTSRYAEIKPGDEVIKVRFKGKHCDTPVIKNRRVGDPTNLITISLEKDRSFIGNNNYKIHYYYAGRELPLEPWDKMLELYNDEEKTRDSKEFWSKYAAVYDDDKIDWEKS